VLTSIAWGQDEGLALFAKGVATKRIYVNNFTAYNHNWSGWTEVPGQATTDAGVAAVSFANAVYVFAVGADSHIWVNRRDGCGFWASWTHIPGGMTTKLVVAPVQFAGKLFLFATGVDNHIWKASTQDGQSWSGWSQLAGSTDVSPAVTAFSQTPCLSSTHKLYVFSKGIGDKRIYVTTSSDGGSWSPWSLIGGTTDVAVNAITAGSCGFSGGAETIHLFAKGIGDKQIYTSQSGDGSSWSGWSLLGGTTDVSVSAYPKDSSGLVPFAKGQFDNRIYVLSSAGGGAWSTWSEVPGGGKTDASIGVAGSGLCY